MPTYSNSVTVNFSSSDYTSNKPSFGATGNYATNLKFANKTKSLQLGTNDYGYTVFEVSYTGSVNYVSVNFTDPNGGNISISQNQLDLYKISNSTAILENVVLSDKTSGTKTYYVIVNSDPTKKTSKLNVSIAIGKYNSAPVTSSVTISYNCPEPINSYTTGLHVYSPWDAQESISKLTTNLYSFTPIESWTSNTVVYASPSLNNPALPYYYGYGSNVYKIGGTYERSYGTQKQITVKKKLFGKPKTTEQTIGPQSFYNSGTTSSDACTVVFTEGVGKVRQIFDNTSLTQPQEYRYYMGYDASNKQKSNDSVFTQYSFATNSSNPIVGATHALNKLLVGVVSGYNTEWKLNEWSAAGTVLGIGLLLPASDATYTFLGQVIAAQFDKFVGGLLPQWLTVGSGFGATLSAILPWVFGALLLYSIITLIFSSSTKTYRESCKQFLYHFTNKPYIEISQIGNDTVLYRDQTLTTINNGYYCDGVYYYQQSGGKIISKELSYTNAIVNDNPVKFQFQYSVAADSPLLVDNFNKLVILPYTSGKPIPYCGGTIYYNNNTLTQTINNDCCDLQTGESVTITVSPGEEFSCISQIDANNKATQTFNALVTYAQNAGQYCTPFADSEIGTLDTSFTHEIKVEDNPTQTTIFYDSRVSGAVIGKTLYYDNSGCQKVLNGYYTISGTSPYRTFYHTTNGVIDGIHTMATSGSTETNTSQPIITTNKDYSSNWYYNGMNKTALNNYTDNIESISSFDPNSLYTDSSLKKGFIKTPITLDDFQLYTNFTGTTYDEAPTGWYRPLIDWISNESFYYYNTETITLDIEEYCAYTGNTVTTRGFYVVGKSSGVLTPTPNPVTMVVKVYTTGDVLTGTFNVTTNTSNARTFVNYGSQVLLNESVTSIVIDSITSTNPFNKVTYTVGTSTVCGPITTPTATNTPTPTVTPTPTPTMLPVSGLTWTTSTNTVGVAGCTDAGWLITNGNASIRYNVSDSANCGGTCSATQTGVATATITVGSANTYLNIDFDGIGERESSAYDKITFKLDGTQIADAHAPGGSLGCLMGPVVKTYQVPGPYLLLANSVHTLRIDFTTLDGLYHVGSYYQVDLSFT